jgi:hypothetical protein
VSRLKVLAIAFFLPFLCARVPTIRPWNFSGRDAPNQYLH